MTAEVTNGTATYNLDDNTIRWVPAERLGPAEYAETRSVGFKWWRSLQAWVAAWTPEREDLVLQHVEAIEHEADPGDPQARIVRFASRAAAADVRADQRVRSAMEGLPPGGEPIKVDHHSARRHRRALERSDTNMRAAVEEGKKAQYWRDRAAGSAARARQQSDPGVVRRRIEKLEAELRRFQRSLDELAAVEVTPQTEARHERNVRHWSRWSEHHELRLAFERGRLDNLTPAPFAPAVAYKTGDRVEVKKWGLCEVVGPGRKDAKNIRVKIISGGARGMSFLVSVADVQAVKVEQ
ncbi:DUF3560 domain-containing protein [Deinococcus sp. Leaf326]|uniref:DUF3560 domain-containing protein n=1 Tax=Deinococcus sp. Leaf326 TaxID=1736338 RepID=UPI0006FB7DEC|nr:DUF3560 domain-containing protein [Deinococcus sp. Leaf326]KQR40725.1 hypothetical protein ASF71_00730 [Deinococcus sp. Leaf326]